MGEREQQVPRRSPSPLTDFYDSLDSTQDEEDEAPPAIETEPRNEEKREPTLEQEYNRYNDKKTPDDLIAYNSSIVRALLADVKVLMIGDSLMRGFYKDLITWLTTDKLASDDELKAKSDAECCGDRLIDLSLLDSDTVFRQAREFQTDKFLLQFFFTTRVMKDDMDQLIKQMLGPDGYPDVIFINSMIWDLTRYFTVAKNEAYAAKRHQKEMEIDCIQKFLDRTSMLLRRLRAVLPPHTMVVWVLFPHCRPSMSTNKRGIPMAPLAEERNYFIRSVMIDGNFRVAQLVKNAGYDVIDFDFMMRSHAFYPYQKKDGMHWHPAGVRLMSQLAMQFLARSWGIDTSEEIERLAEKQNEQHLALAKELLSKYSFYENEVPKLHADLALKTLEYMGEKKFELVEEIIIKGRALALVAQQPMQIFASAAISGDEVQKVGLDGVMDDDDLEVVKKLTSDIQEAVRELEEAADDESDESPAATP